jgi:hypothetical protein
LVNKWETLFLRVSGLICFSYVLPNESQVKRENGVAGCIGTLHPEVGFGLGLREIGRTRIRGRRRIVI